MLEIDWEAIDAERISLKKKKQEISRQIRRKTAEKYNYGNSLPRRGEKILLTGSQGTGKTTTALREIANLTSDNIIITMMFPTLEKAAEAMADYLKIAHPASLPVKLIKGRSAIDYKDNLGNNVAMCIRHEVASRMASQRINVEKFLCNGCPLNDTCGYQQQRSSANAMQRGFFIVTHPYLFKPLPYKRDIIIIDESVVLQAVNEVAFHPDLIDKCLAEGNGELTLTGIYIKTTHALKKAFTNCPGQELESLRLDDITIEDIKNTIRYLASGNHEITISGNMADDKINSILDITNRAEIYKIELLFRQILREYQTKRSGFNSIVYNPHQKISVDSKVEFQPRITVHIVKEIFLPKKSSLLLLDGTGSLLLNKKLFSDDLNHVHSPVERDAEVIQVRRKAFSTQSITGKDAYGHSVGGKQLKEAEKLRSQIIDLIHATPGKILVICTKKVENELRPYLPDIPVIHFGQLRGLNAYESYDTVFVIGRQQISVERLEGLARAFTASDDTPFLSIINADNPDRRYMKQSRGVRMHDGATEMHEIDSHPDPLCQEILQQIREAELAQAIDRVRPIFNHRKIFLLTNVVTDITVSKTITWKELAGGGSRLEQAALRGNALPLSPKEMCRVYPDLWQTEKAAERELDKTPQCQIDLLLEKRGFIRIEYRTDNIRGKPYCAACRGDNPQESLETVIGKLYWFKRI